MLRYARVLTSTFKVRIVRDVEVQRSARCAQTPPGRSLRDCDRVCTFVRVCVRTRNTCDLVTLL